MSKNTFVRCRKVDLFFVTFCMSSVRAAVERSERNIVYQSQSVLISSRHSKRTLVACEYLQYCFKFVSFEIFSLFPSLYGQASEKARKFQNKHTY